jgi:hypothetical protein
VVERHVHLVHLRSPALAGLQDANQRSHFLIDLVGTGFFGALFLVIADVAEMDVAQGQRQEADADEGFDVLLKILERARRDEAVAIPDGGKSSLV